MRFEPAAVTATIPALLFALFLSALLALGGCTRREDADDGAAKTRAAAKGPAAGAGPAARPAAAAALDLCAEHGVLEVICTKCRPNLVPVFQAKGDWCAEHGFPESICPICHPERGGRPAVDVTGEEAPADGLLLRFRSLEIARQAGIETAAAVAGPSDAGIEAPASIVADAANVAVVNASAAGVVRSIRADLGTRVTPGTPLALIESAVVGEYRSRLQAAETRIGVAEEAYRREQGLFEKGVSAAKDVQAALAEWESAKAEAAAARAALGMAGADGGAMAGDGASAEGGATGTYTLRAPIAGVVTKRSATVGTMVELAEPLFEIVNTAKLWAEIDVSERDATRVRAGQRVTLTLDGLEGREFVGTINYVAPVIDPQTRTAKVRAAIRGQDEALRANMFARARIRTGAAPAVLVPREAVQEARGVHLVFVRLAEDRYETRRVRVEAWNGEWVALRGGLAPGEPVVTTGSYLLRTETMKEGIGAGCCEVEPPKR
jgi:cobalt-zinc-cadmium efflux system membrane fusion protein